MNDDWITNCTSGNDTKNLFDSWCQYNDPQSVMTPYEQIHAMRADIDNRDATSAEDYAVIQMLKAMIEYVQIGSEPMNVFYHSF